MKIQAVKFYEKGFMTQPFAFGGEDGPDKFDASKKYRSCLQNYVIDTGSEVVLVGACPGGTANHLMTFLGNGGNNKGYPFNVFLFKKLDFFNLRTQKFPFPFDRCFQVFYLTFYGNIFKFQRE